VFVPRTGDIFLQEAGPADEFVRGVTQDGAIYDFARTIVNQSEFCGGCFSPDGNTFFLNQQGERGTGDSSAEQNEGGAITYAIWGPFARAGRGGPPTRPR
jgi:secreted PhoX family phosphatase